LSIVKIRLWLTGPVRLARFRGDLEKMLSLTGTGGVAAREETVNTDSNARFGREVEWNVSGAPML
jgi:hypothetical protein